MFSLMDVPYFETGGLIIIQDTTGRELATCTTLAMIPMSVRQQAKVWSITQNGTDTVITVSNWKSF